MSANRLRVVGEIVFGGLLAGERLDEGALMTVEGLGDADPALHVMVDPATGADPDGVADAVEDALGYAFVLRVSPPDDLLNVARVRSMPPAFALVVGLVAVATLSHTLLVAVRRRVAETAVLRALGLLGRQIGAISAVQAVTLSLAAVLLAVPAGLVVGRLAWQRTAATVGSAAPTEVPVVAIAASVPLVLVLGGLLSLVPAWRAARIRSAIGSADAGRW